MMLFSKNVHIFLQPGQHFQLGPTELGGICHDLKLSRWVTYPQDIRLLDVREPGLVTALHRGSKDLRGRPDCRILYHSTRAHINLLFYHLFILLITFFHPFYFVD
jgi:hypothetical protein